jgi:hypothetical protein
MITLPTMISIDAHYTPHKNKWANPIVDVCYDRYSLNQLNIGATAAENQLDIARNDWNNLPSQFTINKRVNSPCNNAVYAAHRADTVNAEVLVCVGSICTTNAADLPNGYVTKITTFNREKTWTTVRECDPTEALTMSYTARHEWGHWVVLTHGGIPSETVMYPNYNCINELIKPHDSNELSNLYG